MWLIDVKTLKLKNFVPGSIPEYAILSHTWGDDEPTFQDWMNGTASDRKGYSKIHGCIREARANRIEYVWVDTCCIDKTSSAELSEAINSMFAWYGTSLECYAYLGDVKGRNLHAFRRSRWFTRGWTLQELLAPERVYFFDCAWTPLGTRVTLSQAIHGKTRIDLDLLERHDHWPMFLSKLRSKYSIAKRMSWASRRTTARPEDIAYCLMGIFDVNMPLLYGEGNKAFRRLQEEVIRKTDDESFLAWQASNLESAPSSCLAKSPSQFDNCGGIINFRKSASARPLVVGRRWIEISLLEAEADDGDEDSSFVLNCGEKGQVQGMSLAVTPSRIQAGVFLRVHEPYFRPGSGRGRSSQQPAKRRTILLSTEPERQERYRERLFVDVECCRGKREENVLSLVEALPHEGWCVEDESIEMGFNGLYHACLLRYVGTSVVVDVVICKRDGIRAQHSLVRHLSYENNPSDTVMDMVCEHGRSWRDGESHYTVQGLDFMPTLELTTSLAWLEGPIQARLQFSLRGTLRDGVGLTENSVSVPWYSHLGANTR